MTERRSADVLIIGSGAAGLATALHLADQAHVLVVSKEAIQGGSTNRAQGGVAAVIDPGDSFDTHIADTIRAGAGLCDPNVVRYVVEHGPRAIEQLISHGLEFDREHNSFHLTKEGGHSRRRVMHVRDATGHAIASTLARSARDHPNIELLTGRMAIDLVTAAKLGHTPNRVIGAYLYNRDSNHVELVVARHVVLATGGASKVYLYTTNPDGATGDGIAMAWRAGCRVGNMEFNQFHPTCLFHPQARSFLISEAVRGEGGRLMLANGERFMERFDPRAELASRDIVARAIDHEMKRSGADCVYLDISHRPDAFIHEHFPTILERCKEFGFDLTSQRIPVVPAAHYTCGGVVVDRHAQTDIPGLFAVGEVSCTGLHGANRLASNSLLECLVFAHVASERIRTQLDAPFEPTDVPQWDESQVTDSDEDIVIAHNWDELRRFMWDYVGIVRTSKRLQRAQHRIDLLKQEVNEFYSHYRVSNDLIELRNLIHVAELIVRSALLRKESRGLHFNLDYPDSAEQATDTILFPGSVEHLELLRPRA